MVKISIIIPNYNTEKYLPRCLDSLINQTFKDIEIIVIDDGSKDNSVDVIQKYAKQDKRIKLIRQQNSGPAKARNQGLENAQGKYLMFCDSDDWYEPNMCQVMYDTIEKQKVDVVCCHNFFDFENKLSQELKEKRMINSYFNPKLFGKYHLCQKVRFKVPVVLWNKIFKKELIDEYKIRFPIGNKQDDTAFWFMYSFVAKNIFCLPIQLYHYFLRNNSIASQTISGKVNGKENLSVAQTIYYFCAKNNLINKYHKQIAFVFFQQLQFLKDYISDEENYFCMEETNKTLKLLPKYYRIVFLNNAFILFKRKPSILLLKIKLKYLVLKSHFGTKKQQNKRLKKIKIIQDLIGFFATRKDSV